MRMTYSLVRVSDIMMTDPSVKRWGYGLIQQSGIQAGVMYPLLQRMTDAGWLRVRWERGTGKTLRPLRRYYTVTSSGRAALSAIIDKAKTEERYGMRDK